jgi:GxxExxY protein
MGFARWFKGGCDRRYLHRQGRQDRKGRQGNAKTWMPVTEDAVAAQIVDASIAVHRAFGPGLLESAYLAAMEIELFERGLSFARPLGIVYRADLVVEGKVLIEAKAVREIEDIHIAQVLSYLRLGQLKLGLLLNFNVQVMKRGIKRIANNL